MARKQKFGFRLFILIIIFLSSLIFIFQLTMLTRKKITKNKFAYVFYITEPEYACYAGVNVDRLLDDLSINPNIDILFLYTNTDRQFKRTLESCTRPEVKLLKVPLAPDGLTNKELYAQSYVRFEAFRLIEYDRLIILDADGLIMKNLDHLFAISLDGKSLGGVLVDYLPYDWLSSVLIVIEPNLDLYHRIRTYLTPEGIRDVSIYSNGSHFDMDVLNFAFRSGKNAKILSSDYAVLDSAFVDQNRRDLESIYYIHFTARKPLIYVETRRPKNNLNRETKRIFEIFWKGFEKRCSIVFESSVKMALENFDEMEKESKADADLVRIMESQNKIEA